MIAFHGSNKKFSEFDFINVGNTNGIGSLGWGLYFSTDIDVASSYANPYLYKVELETENSINKKEHLKMNKKSLRLIIFLLNKKIGNNDFLNNYYSVEDDGYLNVLSRVIEMEYEYSSNNIHIFNSLSNTSGDPKLVADLFYFVLGVNIKINNSIVVVTKKECIHIKNIEKLKVE